MSIIKLKFSHSHDHEEHNHSDEHVNGEDKPSRRRARLFHVDNIEAFLMQNNNAVEQGRTLHDTVVLLYDPHDDIASDPYITSLTALAESLYGIDSVVFAMFDAVHNEVPKEMTAVAESLPALLFFRCSSPSNMFIVLDTTQNSVEEGEDKEELSVGSINASVILDWVMQHFINTH